MKTTKLIMIVAFFSFAAIGFSGEDIKTGHLSAKITLQDAIVIPGLVTAIQQQLDPVFLQEPRQPRVFTAEIRFNHVLYVIYATIPEWREFFRMRLIADPER
ncbi:MAG: hypothetical protein B6D61_00665 [Bacteroidetes bacterium 4484_249]|nr:MAG: hypothetical protein B6D61_00665 [Bacteroidetes bacterium 4484_249]